MDSYLGSEYINQVNYFHSLSITPYKPKKDLKPCAEYLFRKAVTFGHSTGTPGRIWIYPKKVKGVGYLLPSWEMAVCPSISKESDKLC